MRHSERCYRTSGGPNGKDQLFAPLKAQSLGESNGLALVVAEHIHGSHGPAPPKRGGSLIDRPFWTCCTDLSPKG